MLFVYLSKRKVKMNWLTKEEAIIAFLTLSFIGYLFYRGNVDNDDNADRITVKTRPTTFWITELWVTPTLEQSSG